MLVRVGGLYISNNGYALVFDILADGTTLSTSGGCTVYPSWSGNNMSTDGSAKVETTLAFFFTGLSVGSHTFQVRWKTNSSSATGYMGIYGGAQCTIFEL